MKKSIFAFLIVFSILFTMVAATPSPLPPPQKLELTFMPPCEPADGSLPVQAEWRIRNNSDSPVEFWVTIPRVATIHSGEAPVGDSFFYTPWGAQTLYLFFMVGFDIETGGDSFDGTICPEESKCRWTGRWVYTYLGNYPCNLVSKDVNPIRFKNPDYVRGLCSHPCLGEWEGPMEYRRIKEMDCGNGILTAGNHYDTSCGELICE